MKLKFSYFKIVILGVLIFFGCKPTKYDVQGKRYLGKFAFEPNSKKPGYFNLYYLNNEVQEDKSINQKAYSHWTLVRSDFSDLYANDSLLIVSNPRKIYLFKLDQNTDKIVANKVRDKTLLKMILNRQGINYPIDLMPINIFSHPSKTF